MYRSNSVKELVLIDRIAVRACIHGFERGFAGVNQGILTRLSVKFTEKTRAISYEYMP